MFWSYKGYIFCPKNPGGIKRTNGRIFYKPYNERNGNSGVSIPGLLFFSKEKIMFFRNRSFNVKLVKDASEGNEGKLFPDPMFGVHLTKAYSDVAVEFIERVAVVTVVSTVIVFAARRIFR
jgi:hypothetical protein